MKLFALFLAALLAATRLSAAELVMVEQAGCHWCARWNEEIGVVYDKTDEGAQAPLRRVDIFKLPDDLTFKQKPQFTPTFVLFDEGGEIGRIEGYPGEDFFWPLLGQLIARLPDGTGE